MRTIRVTGKGNLKVKPDTTRLMITLNGVYPEYAETINRSTAETEALRELLVEVGFKSSAMKTFSFDVDTEFENYRDENNDYKSLYWYAYFLQHPMIWNGGVAERRLELC